VVQMAESQIIKMLINGQNDLAWFDSNISNLQEKYNDKFIAFQDSTVIDSDSDFNNLMKKLKQKNIDISNVLVKFVSKVKFLL